MAIRSDAFHVIKVEGEQHSLLIKEMRPNNAGSYCVTAVNTAGRSSCSAQLHIQSGERARETMEGHQTFGVTVTHLQAWNTHLNEERGT